MTYTSSPDASVVNFQGATLPSPFDVLKFPPGAELCEAFWPIIYYPAVEPPPFDYTLGLEESDGRPFGFGMTFLEYPSQPGDLSPYSNCSSVSNKPLAADSHSTKGCSDLSHKKRPLEDSPFYEFDSDLEPHQSTSKKPKYSSQDAEPGSSSLVFACPFLKQSPHKYRGCAKYVLRRVRDVKQHLNRKHRTPDFYCARCYNAFNHAKERDEHTRYGNCEYRENPPFEGVTEMQKELLHTKERNKSSAEDQWFMIWDILFPGARRPHSVSRYSPWEEPVAGLRDIWRTRHPELLAQVGQSGSKPVIASTDSPIHSLMDKMFDILEAESSLPSQSVRKSSKTLAQDTLPSTLGISTFLVHNSHSRDEKSRRSKA
ncbi:hypothetical protein PG987_010027 [Apiospora arundinis]